MMDYIKNSLLKAPHKLAKPPHKEINTMENIYSEGKTLLRSSWSKIIDPVSEPTLV